MADIGAIVNSMKSDKTIMQIVNIADKANGDVESVLLPPSDQVDSVTMAALQLLLLQSRSEPNIDQNALKSIEESVDLNEFSGFFSNAAVKSMLDMIVKHYALLIKKRLIKQKEAGVLIVGAVINF